MLRLFSFSSRASRAEWWVIYLVVGVPIWLGKEGTPDDYKPGALAIVLLAAIIIVAAWLLIAVSIRRLHDRGMKWTYFLLSLIPGIGGGWLAVECGFLPGTAGPNEFGPYSYRLA
jgi:uncharacterized membrane protein YhaH (DUF805 family)